MKNPEEKEQFVFPDFQLVAFGTDVLSTSGEDEVELPIDPN